MQISDSVIRMRICPSEYLNALIALKFPFVQGKLKQA